ncbi:hypothetical protein TNCV_745411 [Trichonephila clavipes]|nr:hypothetical protein TNCV_745411 [Trichonephila clavipes]
MKLTEKLMSENHYDEFSATLGRPSSSPSPLRLTSIRFLDVVPATEKNQIHRDSVCAPVKKIPESPDNAHSVAFSQRSRSPRLIEDETFNGSDIMNNLIDYEDGQELDSFRVDTNRQ